MKSSEYSYAKLILTLINLAKKHKIQYKVIGHEKFEKIEQVDPIYRFIINPKAKIHFGITAGVQAYEIAGPLTFIKLFNNPKKYFNKKICYHIYPVINPTSWDLKRRNDDDNRDLNNISKITLKSKNYREVQAFYNDIKNKHFNAFLSFHEDNDETRFYAYIFEKKVEPIYRKIIKSIAKNTNILKKEKIYEEKSNKNGLIINHHDRSFEDFLHSRKGVKISICTETPGKLPLNKRININIKNIKLITNYLIK